MGKVGNNVIGKCSSYKKKPVLQQSRDGKNTDSIARWIVAVCGVVCISNESTGDADVVDPGFIL